MIIRKLSLARFRRFDTLELAFAPGLNVIQGPNEAGKSTLLSALKLALFANPASREPEVERARKWGTAVLFQTALEYEWRGQVYRLKKDFQAATATVTDLSTGKAFHDWSQIKAHLAEVTGMASAGLFSSTACIGQGELMAVAEGRQDIVRSLGQVFGGLGGENLVEDSLRELERAMDSYAKGPSPSKMAQDRVTELQGRLRDLMEEREKRRQTEQRLVETEEELAKKRTLLERFRRGLEAFDRRIEAEGKARELSTRVRGVEEKLRAIDEGTARVDELKNRLPPTVESPDSYQALLTRVAEVGARLEDRREEAEQLRRLLEETEGAKLQATSWYWVTVGVGIIVTLAGVAGAVTIAPYLLAVGFIGLGLLLVGLFVGRKRLGAPSDRSLIEESLEQTEEEILTYSRELASLLASLGSSSPEELQRIQASHQESLRKLALAEGRLEALLEGHDAGYWRDQLAEISREIGQWEEAISKSKGPSLAADEVIKVRQQLERIEAEVAALEREQVAAQASLMSFRYSIEDEHSAREALDEAEGELSHIQRRIDALSLAYATLKEAAGHSLAPAKELLQQAIGLCLAHITGGRYQEVSISLPELTLQVMSPDKGGWVSLEDNGDDLSWGTREQLYLCARIALVRLTCGEARPPLLLDDPFVSFDTSRLRRALELCREMASDHQMFLFTCHDVYDRYADHIVKLPGPL